MAVFRALKLGDLLCAVPALRALRRGWPGAEIVLVGLPWAREFAGRFGCYLDGFREFPGYPGLPERAPAIDFIPAFLAAMQAERFDLAIQMHGGGTATNPIVALFGARRTAGFAAPGAFRPDPGLFLPWPERGLEIRRLLALVEHLGLRACGEDLEFPIGSGDRAELDEALGGARLHPGSYAVVHPGASVPERRWPAAHFAAVADEMVAAGLEVVLTGSAAEAELTVAVGRAMRSPARDLAGRTGLGAAAALIDGARLLVSNDTGVVHVAAARRTPSVIVSTGDNPARWAPIDARRHRVLCRDDGVGPREVLAQVEELLRSIPERRNPEPSRAAVPAGSVEERHLGTRGVLPACDRCAS